MAVIPAPSRSASPGHPTFRRRRPLPDEMTGVILVHGVEPVVPTVEAGRRGEPRVHLAQAVIRKGLFLGNFRLDLIHPQPELDPAAVEKGERFLKTLSDFLAEKVDPLQIERDAKIPDEVVQGLKDIGALGMKVPEQYGGLGLSQVYYNKALAIT